MIGDEQILLLESTPLVLQQFRPSIQYARINGPKTRLATDTTTTTTTTTTTLVVRARRRYLLILARVCRVIVCVHNHVVLLQYPYQLSILGEYARSMNTSSYQLEYTCSLIVLPASMHTCMYQLVLQQYYFLQYAYAYYAQLCTLASTMRCVVQHNVE